MTSYDQLGPPSGLSPERLQMFVASLSALAPDEVRKAKLLFLRNEISQFKAILANNSAWRVGTLIMFIMPLCWPALYAQRKSMKVNAELQSDRIRNALSVWSSDLGEDAASLRRELDETAGP
jgi:hypothetical protein